MDYTVIIQAFWIAIPIYIANASAVIVGGGTPIDSGKSWKDGRRILGDGKTWRGLFAGAFLGMTAGFGLAVAASYLSTSEYSFLRLTNFEGFPLMIPILFSLCFGALLGDIIESFFKRRIGKDRGQDWIPFDQLDFIVGALILQFFDKRASRCHTCNRCALVFRSYHDMACPDSSDCHPVYPYHCKYSF